MEKHTLSAQKRTTFGRKVKTLRKSGNLPANIYGKKVKSASIAVSLNDFEKVYKKAGETGLVEIQLEGEVRPVLIHNIQFDPVKMKPIHADFYQVDLKEKVQAKVPVVLVGQASAVTNKTGILLTLLDEIEVEALPAHLPEKIEVKVTDLTNIDQAIKVADVKLSSDVKILTPADREIVKVASLISKEAEKQAAEEQAAKAAAEAAAATATVTGEAGTAAPTAAAPGAAVKEESPKASTPKA